MSFNSGLNPEVVKVDLDKVFYQEYNRENLMNYVTAESASIFNQSTADNAAVQIETFSGVGYWQNRAEEQDVHSSNPRVANKATYSVLAYADSVDIPKHFYDDNIKSLLRGFRQVLCTA